MKLGVLAGVFVAALLAALAGLLLLLPLGLVVHELVLYPLAFVVTALLAALAAAWTGALARDGTRTRLLPVVGTTIASGIMLAAILVAGFEPIMEIFGRVIVLAVAVAIFLAADATAATALLRKPQSDARGDTQITFALLGIAILAVPVAIFLASLVGLTGA
jgi:ABC-2 type transport system permease protein